MPTLIGHLAVPLAARLGLGSRRVGGPLLAAAGVLAVLPDADVIGFRFGVGYGDLLGHRGFTHSILFAVVAAGTVAGLWRARRGERGFVFAFLLVAALSHGVLDACTNGGLGVAFLSPFSNARSFAPLRPIEVSPLTLREALSPLGLRVLWSEVAWLWLPFLSLAGLAAWIRRRRPGERHRPGMP